MRSNLVAAGLAALACAPLFFVMGFMWWPAQITWQGQEYGLTWNVPATQQCLGRFAIAHLAPQRWEECSAYFRDVGGLEGFVLRARLLIGAVVCAAACLSATWMLSTPSPERIIRGRRLCSVEQLRKVLQQECAQLGAGLEIMPGVRLSRDRESRHFLVWGSSGGGKTQALLHLLLPAIARGDRAVVLDVKGDMTGSLSGGRQAPVLIAPHDARSHVWDIAADIRIVEEAEELASRLIPVSDKDPMWGQAAGSVFVACLACLQQRFGTEWTWRELHELVTSDVRQLYDIADEHYPDARRLLEDMESRTTNSILINLASHMRLVRSLAAAWGDDDGRPRFSMRDWMMSPSPDRQVVILQRSAQFPGLSSAWIGAMVSAAAAALGDPAMSESQRRRIWLVLDEFPQLPRLNDFSSFLETGRSKGVVVALGVQDVAQLRKTYGRDLADSWLGIIGTQIVTRINPGPGAEEASRLIGMQEVERKHITTQTAEAGAPRGASVSMQREKRPVVSADEISTTLGPQPNSVRVLLLGPGADVYRVDLPYITLPSRRAPSAPAAWTTIDEEPAPEQRRLPSRRAAIEPPKSKEIENER